MRFWCCEFLSEFLLFDMHEIVSELKFLIKFQFSFHYVVNNVTIDTSKTSIRMYRFLYGKERRNYIIFELHILM